MLALKKYTGVKIVSYSIITISLMTLAGIPILYFFARFQNLEFPEIDFDLGITIFIAAFGLFSAKGYLEKKNWSRLSLL